jgi:ferredoxin
MERVNDRILAEVKKLGAVDFESCYSCGTCSAVCPLSAGTVSFPRRMIRDALLGLEGRILSAPEPWLCYYCGECSETCPRQAEPAALMMALRRFATRKYSLGRVADALYSSMASVFTWIVFSAMALVFVLLAFNPQMNREQVDFMSFIGLEPIHWAGIVLVAFIILVSLTQIGILFRNLRRGAGRAEWRAKKAALAAWHALSESVIQKRFDECDSGRPRRLAHMAVSWGFMGMFLATIIIGAVDFKWLPWPRWVSLVIGSFSGVLTLLGLSYYVYLRLRRKTALGRYSHPSDWAFLILLILSVASGFVMLFFRLLNWPMAAYVTFAFHLVAVFDLLVTFPFSKFAHVIYRPLALWLAGFK